jgi:Flp pilus assembly secretin CpaC
MQRHMPGFLRSSLALIAVVTLAACSSLPETPPVGPGKRLAQAPVTAPAPQDEAITQNVRSQLSREVPLADIGVSTAQGKVQLTGTVDDSEQARRAVKGALAIDGVRGVVNDLDVAKDGADGTALAASAL